MPVVIDVHCHLLHADAVELDSFISAYCRGIPPLRNLPPLAAEFFKGLLRTLSCRDAPPAAPRSARRDAKGVPLGDLLRRIGKIPELGTTLPRFRLGLLARALDWGLPRWVLIWLMGKVFGGSLDLDQIFLSFAPVFTDRQRGILKGFLRTYEDHGVDLFVPLMTDYEDWLGGEPRWHAWRTSTDYAESRVDYKKRLIREHKGRIHCFAPFCPLRAAAAVKGCDTPGSVDDTVDLVEKHGFLGVKLYPLMGYFPTDNVGRQGSERPSVPPGWESLDVRWQDVDDALDELYGKCTDKGIPITAHCSPQGALGPTGATPDVVTDANHSHPGNWKAVLDQHGKLRLNLAHMAGDHFQNVKEEDRSGPKDWAYCIAKLMDEFGNVYSDRSCQTPPMEDTPGGMYRDYVARHLDILRVSSKVRDRIMYGSDWHLALMYAGQYLEARERLDRMFGRQEFLDEFGDLRPGFFGENAARFLGICSGDPAQNPNRGHLETFYTTELGLEPEEFPAWWSKV